MFTIEKARKSTSFAKALYFNPDQMLLSSLCTTLYLCPSTQYLIFISCTRLDRYYLCVGSYTITSRLMQLLYGISFAHVGSQTLCIQALVRPAGVVDCFLYPTHKSMSLPFRNQVLVTVAPLYLSEYCSRLFFEHRLRS